MELDEQQMAAVTSDAVSTLVLAGAGSGKTQVIVSRVKHLVSQGVPTSRILLATFTRRAAQQINWRLRASGINTESMLCGTLHSVLRDLIGDERTVLSQPQADRLLMRCARDLSYYDPETRRWKSGLSFKKVSAVLQHQYTKGFNKKEDDNHTRILILIKEYRTRLNTTKTTDYGGILVHCHNMLNMSTADHYRRIDHVLIDEVQDTDMVQHMILDELCPPAQLFMVGDIRQSIYRWRGAEPEHAGGRGRSCFPLHVSTSYRCPAEVITAANRLSANDPHEPCRVPMVSGTMNQGLIEWTECGVEGLANGVQDLIDGSPTIEPRDIAILARRHASLEEMERELRLRGIKTFRVGADLLELAESRRAFYALLATIDRQDLWMGADDLMECLNYSDGDRAFAWSAARQRDSTLLAGWSQVDWPESPHVGNELPRFIQSIGPGDTVGKVCGAWETLTGQPNSEGTKWWLDHFGSRTVHQTVTFLGMSDIQDWSTDASDSVTLSTVHGAKGLEWPIVIVMDLNEGVIPKSDADVDDDRRVFYVALTRSQSRVVVHNRPEGSRIGQWTPCGVRSRFLDEIGLTPASPVFSRPADVSVDVPESPL